MAKEALYTMVAGGALEADSTFNVRCNCGGKAPIRPTSVKGFGFGKKGGATKVVAQIETACQRCKTPIKVSVLEGDPSYLLVSKGGVESLFLPQGSTSAPVSALSKREQQGIIAEMKQQAKAQREKNQRKGKK